jgi:hypothetical protein
MARSTALAETSAAPPAILSSYAIADMDIGSIAEIVRENVGASGIDRFSLDRIQIPAGGGTTWEVPTLEGNQPTRELKGVIVYYTDQRAFWREKYGSGGGNSPPDCSSSDLIRGHGDPGVECAECPFSKFGTATKQDGTDGRGQACRQVRVMFVMLPHSILPVVVAIPPGSLSRKQDGGTYKYFMRLASQGIPYHGVQTSLTLAKTSSADGTAYSQVNFGMAGRLSPEEHRMLLPLRQMLQAQSQTIDSRDFTSAEVV